MLPNLSPFKLWTLQNFPFIEADFDAITNYQLMCKLVEYLNKNIETINSQTDVINTLNNNFNTLKNYVDNYLTKENLQPMINEKLDEFAEDGTLETLISKYIDNSLIRCYPNVDAMKNDDLKTFQKVKTLGYYTANDGGGVEYLITNTADENYHYEELNNGKFAELISKNVNILQCGAKGDNQKDNTTIIQNCLNKYDCVYIPTGTYKSNPIYLKSYQKLYGDGKKSIISAISDSDDGLLNIMNENIKTEIKDLQLYGNNKNIDGILISRNSQTSIDSNEIFNNIIIQFFNKNGINLNSTFIRSCIIDKCNISNCNKDGIYLKGTDNFIINTLSYWNKGNGISIIDGSANKIENSKCFGNSLNGLYVNGSALQITNFEAQDNYRCGIHNYQSWGNQYINVVSSSNGVDSQNGSNYPNILFENSYDCNYIGDIINRNTPQVLIMHSKFGAKCLNSSNITIDAKLHLLNIDLIPFDNENLNISNKININNVKYNIKNIYDDNFIGLQGETEGLSHLFTLTNARANSDGSFVTNIINNSQEMKIGNNSSIDGSGFISVYGEHTIDNDDNNISLYVNGSNNKTSQSTVSGIISFLNSAGGLISSSNEMYGANGFEISSQIPPNTAKIKYTISYRPLILNLNGTYSITNIQLGTYKH